GRGTGDGRNAGQGAGGDISVPREERWRLRFAGSLNEYAKQLDYFGIELSAIGGGAIIDFASCFSGSSPNVRTGTPEMENANPRFYFRIPTSERTLLGFTSQLLSK